MLRCQGEAAGLIKRSFSLAGRCTSVALEPEFWAALERRAQPPTDAHRTRGKGRCSAPGGAVTSLGAAGARTPGFPPAVPQLRSHHGGVLGPLDVAYAITCARAIHTVINDDARPAAIKYERIGCLPGVRQE